MSKTRAELKLELDKIGVKYEEEATVKELEALLASSDTSKILDNDFDDLTGDIKTEVESEDKKEEVKEEKEEVKTETKSEKPVQNIKDTNDEYMKSVLKVKEVVNKERKVSIHIPLSQGEKRGEAIETVTINGYSWNIRKGEMVEVPLSVYKILADSMGLVSAADEFKVDRDNETVEALN